MFLPQEIVRKKRDREELTAAEIGQFVEGIMDGGVDRSQIAAFTMAVYLHGMTPAEQVALTLAMRDSGTVLRWEAVEARGQRVMEKHSSGGVGDEKVTLIVVPLVAACGLIAPNISGRSLGHTGGELDLLEAIPGYQIQPTKERFRAAVEEVGGAIIGPTPDLAPADRAIFHVRDVTSTVESIPLIVSSILSKKLAAGAQGMVMTVPFGTGAFMRREQDAVDLATALIEVAGAAGLPMVALISDLEQVLGDAVGNALQIFEVIAFLQGTARESRLLEVVLTIAAEMVALAGVAAGMDEVRALVLARLEDGSAATRFARMVEALGGPADLMERPEAYLARAEVVEAVYPEAEGLVHGMDCWEIGMALVEMGAGRTQPEQTIDYAVGISGVAHVGDRVGSARPLCRLHARDLAQWERAAAALRRAYRIGEGAVTPEPVIRRRLASAR